MSTTLLQKQGFITLNFYIGLVMLNWEWLDFNLEFTSDMDDLLKIIKINTHKLHITDDKLTFSLAVFRVQSPVIESEFIKLDADFKLWVHWAFWFRKADQSWFSQLWVHSPRVLCERMELQYLDWPWQEVSEKQRWHFNPVDQGTCVWQYVGRDV